MTGLWIAILIAMLAAVGWLIQQFLKRAEVIPNEAESAISIFRDQVDEVRRDLDAGLISSEEADAAQQEIEARALRAAKSMSHEISVSRRSPMAAMVLAGVCVVAAIGLYMFLGAPNQADQPLHARKLEVLNQQAAAGDLNSRIQLLIERTRENPRSFEDWWMLARSYSAVGDHASAADAYRRAAELSGDRPAVLSAYAESLTLANGNKVPQAARLVFEQILQDSPDPRARYYVALAKAQNQEFAAALEDWTALARDSQPGAPWMAIVRRDIVNMARFLKRDVTAYLPDATATEIAQASGAAPDDAALERQVAALRSRLDTDPKDYKAWIELARVQASLGRDADARQAIDDGRQQFSAAPFVLGKFEEAARSLGLDILADTATVGGPTSEDVVAAATLSDEDRANMIAGMVAGLAAKLEENPDNPDGWIMLIRSYAVIGDTNKARAAYEKAVDHFRGNAAVVARLKDDAGSLVVLE